MQTERIRDLIFFGRALSEKLIHFLLGTFEFWFHGDAVKRLTYFHRLTQIKLAFVSHFISHLVSSLFFLTLSVDLIWTVTNTHTHTQKTQQMISKRYDHGSWPDENRKINKAQCHTHNTNQPVRLIECFSAYIVQIVNCFTSSRSQC